MMVIRCQYLQAKGEMKSQVNVRLSESLDTVMANTPAILCLQVSTHAHEEHIMKETLKCLQ